ncbi:MAG: insulinase family protein [Gammaproteobacteria bacterium]|nr:insulinase family protein [Gammaproteobacteria bacterium]
MHYGGAELPLRLANGVELHTRPIAARATAAVALWWHTGRLHESPDEVGAAHLLEHLVCEALPAAALARWGGAVNGQSGREWTVWHALLPAAAAPDFLRTLVWALRAPLPPDAHVQRESRVLAAEIGAATARDHWEHGALRACFGAHPLARPLAVLPDLDLAGLTAFRARLLTGPRLRVTAAGGLDPDALAAAIRPLEELPASRAAEPAAPALPIQPCYQRRSAAGALWLLPFALTEAAAVAELALLLADPLVGELPRQLRNAAEPLYGLHCELEFCAGIGLWWLRIDAGRVAAVLEAGIEQRIATGFTAAELARVRALRHARQILEGEDLLGQLEVLAGARPAPPTRSASAATLARVLATCWQRRCRVLGD